MGIRPSYGANKMPLIGYLQKVETQARTTDNANMNRRATNLTHSKVKQAFRFNVLNKEYMTKTYAEILQNFKLKDSSVVIRTYSDIDFGLDDKITTDIDIGGLISGEPKIITLSQGYNGKMTFRETIIIIDG